MVYSTSYDKNADRQIPDRTNRPPPDLFVPGRRVRYRSGIQQYRGMVAVDSGRAPAAQGSAVLSSARREFGVGIRRLRIRTESVARRIRRADPALAGRRDFCQRQIGRLSAPEPVAELNLRPRTSFRGAHWREPGISRFRVRRFPHRPGMTATISRPRWAPRRPRTGWP